VIDKDLQEIARHQPW